MKRYTVCVSVDLCPLVLNCFAQGFKKPVKISVVSVDEQNENSFYISCRIKDSDGKLLKELRRIEKSIDKIAPESVFVVCDSD